MKFGKLFKKLSAIYDIDTLSANHFSDLKYKEMRSIAKALKANEWTNENYTHYNTQDMAAFIYYTVKNH